MEKKKDTKIEDKIKDMVETIRPYLNMDGGDIEYVKYEDHIVYVKLTGACSNCLGQDSTLNDSLLVMFQDEVPEIKGIINVPI